MGVGARAPQPKSSRESSAIPWATQSRQSKEASYFSLQLKASELPERHNPFWGTGGQYDSGRGVPVRELEGAAGGTLPHLVGPDLGRRPATPISYAHDQRGLVLLLTILHIQNYLLT
jgi:hypothetical protein